MKISPLFAQYDSFKKACPDSILLFKMGYFYEAFNADAEQINKVLNLGIVARGATTDKPRLMCGFPYWALDSYISKLATAGLKVSVCDPVLPLQPAGNGLVARTITRHYEIS